MNRPEPLTARHGRRVWLLSAGSLLIAAAAAAPHGVHAAQTASETRDLKKGFDEVVFAATGELDIVQAQHERLTIEAEPQILRKITSEVRGRQLVLGFTSGNVVAREPIRFRLEMPTLRLLELQSSGNAQLGDFDVTSLSLLLGGSGDLRLDRLTAQSLKVRLPGSGTISIAHGRVDTQRIEIAGAGTVDTAGLESRNADVSITGSGDVRLAASKRLQVTIAGSGSVRYSGDPQLTQSVTGAGSVERE